MFVNVEAYIWKPQNRKKKKNERKRRRIRRRRKRSRKKKKEEKEKEKEIIADPRHIFPFIFQLDLVALYFNVFFP